MDEAERDGAPRDGRPQGGRDPRGRTTPDRRDGGFRQQGASPAVAAFGGEGYTRGSDDRSVPAKGESGRDFRSLEASEALRHNPASGKRGVERL
jgi:hypothetical protein